MARTQAFSMKVEPELKNEAEVVLKELGISLSDAINIFLTQVVLHNGLPFELKLPPTNLLLRRKLSMMHIYPARFEPAEEGGFNITFPDLPGAITCGDNLKEAMYMAQDCLGGFLWAMEEDGDTFPNASEINSLTADDNGTFYSLISVDLVEYKRTAYSKKFNNRK